MPHTNPDPQQGPQKRDNRFADPDMTPRREGGDDALAEIHPTDSRADEKVIVNGQESNRTVNRPPQGDVGAFNDEVVND